MSLQTECAVYSLTRTSCRVTLPSLLSRSISCSPRVLPRKSSCFFGASPCFRRIFSSWRPSPLPMCELRRPSSSLHFFRVVPRSCSAPRSRVRLDPSTSHRPRPGLGCRRAFPPVDLGGVGSSSARLGPGVAPRVAVFAQPGQVHSFAIPWLGWGSLFLIPFGTLSRPRW